MAARHTMRWQLSPPPPAPRASSGAPSLPAPSGVWSGHFLKCCLEHGLSSQSFHRSRQREPAQPKGSPVPAHPCQRGLNSRKVGGEAATGSRSGIAWLGLHSLPPRKNCPGWRGFSFPTTARWPAPPPPIIRMPEPEAPPTHGQISPTLQRGAERAAAFSGPWGRDTAHWNSLRLAARRDRVQQGPWHLHLREPAEATASA